MKEKIKQVSVKIKKGNQLEENKREGEEENSEEEERAEKINIILKQTAVMLLLCIYL